MRSLLAIAVLILVAGGGCIPDRDPEAEVDCYGWSVNGRPFVGTCDLACERPGEWPHYEGAGCQWDETDPLGYCTATFEWNGARGCCEFTERASRVEFRECL